MRGMIQKIEMAVLAPIFKCVREWDRYVNCTQQLKLR